MGFRKVFVSNRPGQSRCRRTGIQMKVCTVMVSWRKYTSYKALFRAIQNGADEIDMVINIALIKNLTLVEENTRAVVDASGTFGKSDNRKTCLLTETEKVVAARLPNWQEQTLGQTPTGFSTGWSNCSLMRQVVDRIWE